MSRFEEDHTIRYLPGKNKESQKKSSDTENSVNGRRLGAGGSRLVSQEECHPRESDLHCHL